MKTIIDLCEQTPLVSLRNISDLQHAEICIKLERTNCSGSIKDRPAKYIIELAEKKGLLKSGGTIIESSSGNFGIACAMIGAAKGYRVIIIVDPKTTPTNLALLKVYGAKIVVIDKKDEDGSYHKSRISFANRLHQEIPNSFRPDQCFNTQNSDAHYYHTAPEIMEQCDGKIDALIISVSTGGQLGGFSRYFREYSPKTKIIAIEPEGSCIFSGPQHSYLLPGMGLSWTPNNISNLELIDEIYKVPDEDAFLACRNLARHEGILTGGSTGASLIVALKLSQKMGKNKRIVLLACDSGERYLDTIYNNTWMQERDLKTECSVEELYGRANKLAVFSKNPSAYANYQPHILEELKLMADKIPSDSSLLKSVV